MKDLRDLKIEKLEQINQILLSGFDSNDLSNNEWAEKIALEQELLYINSKLYYLRSQEENEGVKEITQECKQCGNKTYKELHCRECGNNFPHDSYYNIASDIMNYAKNQSQDDQAIIEKQEELIKHLLHQPQTSNTNNAYVLYWKKATQLENDLTALRGKEPK